MSDNKRIAKNTMLLYVQMLLTMVVSLYTSRVVLNTLGVSDYGIFNVVGGFVGMFGFLNSAMASATQRFLTFELGKRDLEQTRNVFNMSSNIHILIAIAVFVLAQTVGLWFLNNKLIIPLDRVIAAKWVFQFSILSLLVNIISVPYNALIIAHERMGVFAWVAIIQVVLNLLIVFMLQWFGVDKLKLYSILIFGVSLIIRTIYGVYCKRKFAESKLTFFWDYALFKRLFSHVGWMLFGTTTNMLSGQGINMLMNMFFGVTVNASRGVAFQIQGVVNSFVSNFMTAVNPQIVKSFAQNNLGAMYDLVFRSSKFSFYLILYISLPVLLLTNTILQWWLKIVPDYAVLFTQLVVIDLYFTVLFGPIATVSQATGKIKPYQLIISVGFLLVFILTYVFFKLGFSSYYAFIITIIMSFVGLLARIILLKFQIGFPIKKYFIDVLLRVAAVFVFAVPIPYFLNTIIDNEVSQFFLVAFASVLTVSISIWFIGITKTERRFIIEKVKSLNVFK